MAKVEGKKKAKPKKPSQRWKKYRIEGEKVVAEQFCPRCGHGIFLAKSANRIYCGKCHYTEFLQQAQAKKAEEQTKK